MNPKDPSTLVSVLNLIEANKLIESGVISGGMLPKVNNCIAVNSGVGRVHILDGRILPCFFRTIYYYAHFFFIIVTAVLKKNLLTDFSYMLFHFIGTLFFICI